MRSAVRVCSGSGNPQFTIAASRPEVTPIRGASMLIALAFASSPHVRASSGSGAGCQPSTNMLACLP
jgi:hypothetical protein